MSLRCPTFMERKGIMLIPTQSPNLVYDQDFSAIKKKIDADYASCRSDWERFWSESTIDVRLEAGDAALNNQLNQSQIWSGREQWCFNRVRPLLNLVSGYQRRNRKTTIVVPQENADQHTADQWTKLFMQIYKREGIYETISEAFHQGACITGLNLLHVYLDFRSDPVSGDIKIDNCPYNTFFIDPYFRNRDLSDCSFVWRRSYLTYSAAASLMPDKYDEIMNLTTNTTNSGNDTRFQYMPESYGMSKKKRLAYDEYYYRDYREQDMLVDKETGETLDVSEQDNFDVNAFLQAYPQCTIIKQNIPTVRLAVMIQDKIFYDGPQPTGIDDFPFIAITGYYNSMMPSFYSRIQGIARSLRDPQVLLNRRIMLSADLIESQANSGWIFKENAVMDVKHLFQTGAGRIIPLKREAQMTDIVPIVPPQIPPSFFQLQETFDKELNMVSGITETNLGQTVKEESGYLAALRQAAGMMTLEPIFDRLNIAQNMLGDIVMQVIRRNYTPGKIKLLLGGEEPAPLFYNKAFGRYHCVIENGYDTETQRQLEFAQLMKLKEMGFNVPTKAMINAATIQHKDEIIAEMEQAEQGAMQMQMAQGQAEVQEVAARIELAKARATADRGLGLERASRVEENEQLAVERKAQAHKDDTESLLAFIKAMKEIDSIDFAHLEQLISMQKMLREPNEPVKSPIKKE
jgi:hypothetical protein